MTTIARKIAKTEHLVEVLRAKGTTTVKLAEMQTFYKNA